MSLVTTARFSSSLRTLQSAAVSAVLPLPTGPPMPRRSARPLLGAAWCWSGPWLAPMWFPLWSGFEEPEVRPEMELGEDVEEWSGRGGNVRPFGEVAGLGGHRVHLRGE